MDGNRRWAKKRSLPIQLGHKKGIAALKNIVKVCTNLKIKNLTIFAFSTENWNRLPSEVNTLIKLIEWYLNSEIAEISKANIKISFIGHRQAFNKTLQKLMFRAEKLTENNDGMKFNVALNYGGRSDFVYAVKNIIKKIEDSKLKKHDINEKLIKNNLMSSKIEDVDLVIRTSGETRLSNFLMWQLQYSELYFTETLWPDFDELELEKAIKTFYSRERRYGSSVNIYNDSFKS